MLSDKLILGFSTQALISWEYGRGLTLTLELDLSKNMSRGGTIIFTQTFHQVWCEGLLLTIYLCFYKLHVQLFEISRDKGKRINPSKKNMSQTPPPTWRGNNYFYTNFSPGLVRGYNNQLLLTIYLCFYKMHAQLVEISRDKDSVI